MRNIWVVSHQYCLRCATLTTNLCKNMLFQMKNIICYEFDIHDGSSRINLMLQHYFGFLAIYGQSKKDFTYGKFRSSNYLYFFIRLSRLNHQVKFGLLLLLLFYLLYITSFYLRLLLASICIALPQLAWDKRLFFFCCCIPWLMVTHDLVDSWCFSVMLLCRWYVHWGTEWAGRISCRDVVWADSCTLHSDQ